MGSVAVATAGLPGAGVWAMVAVAGRVLGLAVGVAVGLVPVVGPALGDELGWGPPLGAAEASVAGAAPLAAGAWEPAAADLAPPWPVGAAVVAAPPPPEVGQVRSGIQANGTR